VVERRQPPAGEYYAPSYVIDHARYRLPCRRRVPLGARRERRLPGAIGFGQIRDALYQLFY
jgi:hypothetical protein